MPSERTPLPGHPSKPGKEKTNPGKSLKAESLCSEEHIESGKMAGSIDPGGKSHHPASEGEKDSGFSDVSSEYLSNVEQTDTEDQSALPLRQPVKLQRVPQKAAGGVTGGAFSGITPVYIVKNVILKQPLGASPSTQFLAWSSQHPLDSNQSSPARVLLIQQPVTALKPLLAGRKTPSKETYLPVLNTYPKIAPHPGCDSKAKAGAEPVRAGGASKSKRFCLEEAWVSSSEPATSKDGKEKQQEEPPPPTSSDQAASTLSPEAISQNTVTSSTGAAMPSLNQAEGRMISKASKRLISSSMGKQRRFHNTVEILRKSGLLGITLRTKELIRQNSSTQRDLVELREHVQLLCEAVQSNDSQAWARLQEAMNRSAAYWVKKGAGSYAQLGPNLAAETASPSVDVTSESPPSSPMNLSLTPDTSVHMTLP